ncbi:hypothetical protein [Mucilaginibacter flavidus]|uniref:hypothetical protein n=1 Tax=Mucilaginibacter flavidus TaxID=2949309 RepID=UPI002093959C|nr:hypothetical protein [Mucilaginibacter flavidus]MCO5946359.1 hypothetical protein [Mucilaginibacter flavidus]
MKIYLLIALAFCFLLTACRVIEPDYFGEKYPPTTHVDIFYSTHDVKKDYKVIGHMNLLNFGQDSVKIKFVRYAQKIGADAIVITGNTVNDSVKGGSDVVNADALKYN